jgi:hypothetical protein
VIDVSLQEPSLAPAIVTHVLDFLQECKGRKRHVDSGLQRRFEQIALDGFKAGLLPEPHSSTPCS